MNKPRSKHVRMAYKVFPHAFLVGCGRETMAYYFHCSNMERFDPKDVRNLLMALVKRGQFTKLSSKTGHTIFMPRLEEHFGEPGKDYIILPRQHYDAWLKQEIFKEIEPGVGEDAAKFRFYKSKPLPR